MQREYHASGESETVEGSIRILLVDDHALLRLGLRSLFRTVPRFSVVGEAASAAAAIAEVTCRRPDIVIMDVKLPDGSGIETCREIRAQQPATQVIMLTSCADDDIVVEAMVAGAAAYLLNQIAPERLVEAVETVSRGGSLIDPALMQAVLKRMRFQMTQAPEDQHAVLSSQEQRILPLIAEGKTNREIAAALYLSEHTVKTYVSDILRKLHLSRRAEAAAFAVRFQRTVAPLSVIEGIQRSCGTLSLADRAVPNTPDRRG